MYLNISYAVINTKQRKKGLFFSMKTILFDSLLHLKPSSFSKLFNLVFDKQKTKTSDLLFLYLNIAVA